MKIKKVEIENFVYSVKNNTNPLVDCSDGIKILEIAKEAEKGFYDSTK